MEALFKIPNLIFIAAGSMVSLVALAINPTLGFFTGAGFLVTEAAALLLLGNSKGFQAKIRHDKGWGGGLVNSVERGKMATALYDENVERYQKIRMKYRVISKRAQDDFSQNPMIIAAVQKLESLTDSYLKLLITKQRLKKYLSETDGVDIETQLSEAHQKTKEAPAKDVQLLINNMEMIKKRLDQIKKAEKNLSSFEAQLQKIELSVDLVHDNMVSMDGITEVGTQIDLMLTNLEDAEGVVTEMESLVMADPIDDTIPQILQTRVR